MKSSVGSRRSVSACDRRVNLSACGRIAALARLSEGWDTYDALPAARAAVKRAPAWLAALRSDAEALGAPWIDPNITGSASGEVVFEWWYGPRKLTVYVSQEAIEYVASWGANMLDEMQDGDISAERDRRRIWAWLFAEPDRDASL